VLAKGKAMAERIGTGTILIKEGALLPDSLRFESAPCSNGWREVKNLDGRGLDRKIREAIWIFFYLAGEVRASGFGLDREAVVSKAVRRALAKVKLDLGNSLEVTEVTAKRFLGLSYVTVSAHAPHIQEIIAFCRP
jgi:hypothetical protein